MTCDSCSEFFDALMKCENFAKELHRFALWAVDCCLSTLNFESAVFLKALAISKRLVEVTKILFRGWGASTQGLILFYGFKP